MVATHSYMMPLGTIAPSFSLLDVISEKEKSLEQLKGSQGTVIMFICAHCPFVKHLEHKIGEVAKKYNQHQINFVAISSNDVASYPEDAPEKLKEQALIFFDFPYLYDKSQNVARSYQASCTPDFFLFDSQLSCVYRGRFDASTPSNSELVSGESLIEAVDALLHSQSPIVNQHPSIGCGIKWK